MQNINVFHKGINSDLDYSKRDGQVWDFPTLNARLINHKGQGYIITNMNGNDFDVSKANDTVGIELPLGFVPLGACQLNGIAYIVSLNEVTGEGEIGCFPSPAVIANINYTTPSVTLMDSVSGFNRRYRPLINFNNENGRHPFRTTEFKFDVTKLIDMFAVTSFDRSVDIYMADGKNLNRIINSGFNDIGELTIGGRFYTDNSFPFIVSHVPLVNSIPQKETLIIEKGGILKSGNYYIHLRYVTESFNRTHFLNEVGPISIFAGISGDKYSVEGVKGDGGDSGVENETDKRIRLTLSNLDQEYKYLEIGITRHWSDDAGVIVDDVYTIDKLIEITNTSETIILDGYETLLSLTHAELIAPAQKDLIAESHTIVDNRYFGVNWKRYGVHNNHLYEHARRIVPGFNDSHKIALDTGYKSYENIIDYVGFFRFEIYPTGVVYVFKGGIESDTYPTAGIDDINNLHLVIEDGIYRFPSHALSPTYNNAQLNILGLTFDTTSTNNNKGQSANDYYTENESWFQENIIGFYFVRGDRFKNMLYQGVAMYGTRSYRMKTSGARVGDFKGILEQYDESATMFNGGINGDNPVGSVPHGCSSIEYDIGTSDYDYYDKGRLDILGNLDRIGVFRRTVNNWAVWLGQAHKKHVEDQSASSYWGANRTNSVGGTEHGGKDDTMTGKGDANECHYNDHWMEDNEEQGLIMPIWKGFFPCCNILNKNSEERKTAKNFMGRAYYVEKKYALICPDYIFNRFAIAPEGSVIRKLATFKYNENDDGYGLSQIYGGSNDKDTYPWWWFADISGYTYYDTPTLIEDAKFTDVPKYTKPTSAKDGFVSEYTDPGFEDNQIYGFSNQSNCMWWWYKDEGRSQGGGNRSMSTCKYIGITLNEHIDDVNHSLCSMFQIDPLTLSENDLINYFDLKNEQYHKISNMISLGVSTIATILFKGDCFLQKTYIKQMSWRGSSWNIYQKDNERQWSGLDKDRRETSGGFFGLDDEQKLINFGHGMVIAIVTENEINAELRCTYEERTFYPKCGEDGLKSFAVYSPDTTDKTETLSTNAGYNQMTSMKVYRNYNLDLPFVNMQNETRVRYSDKLIIGSFVNTLRNLRIADFEDYDTSRGAMLRCFNHLNYLVTYQKEGINLHYANERQAKIDTDQGSIFMGSGEPLAQQVKVLSNNGIQHKWAVIKGEKGILSLDWNKRSVNYVSLGIVGTTTSLVCSNTSQEKMISSYLYELCENFNKLTDIKAPLPDTIMSGIGISSGYDRKYGELYLSIRYAGVSKTLVYNDMIDAFIGEASFVSPFYLTLNNDFYSAFWNGGTTNSNKIYRHDIDTKIQTFYGTIYPWLLTVIVNGASSENSTVNYSKRFSSLEIESAEIGFSEIQYSTLKQIGLHDTFNIDDERFWIAPTYLEGKWKFPIQSQTSGDDFYSGNEFDKESDMRGEWMKIELRYTGTERLFIKSIITYYEISNF